MGTRSLVHWGTSPETGFHSTLLEVQPLLFEYVRVLSDMCPNGAEILAKNADENELNGG